MTPHQVRAPLRAATAWLVVVRSPACAATAGLAWALALVYGAWVVALAVRDSAPVLLVGPLLPLALGLLGREAGYRSRTAAGLLALVGCALLGTVGPTWLEVVATAYGWVLVVVASVALVAPSPRRLGP